MNSKQNKLRRLMKLEKEKKRSSSDMPDAKKKKDPVVKGILKSKSNYSSTSSLSPTKQVSVGIKGVKSEHLPKSCPSSTANENIHDEDDDAMKEFEDFLDSVDDDGKEATDEIQKSHEKSESTDEFKDIAKIVQNDVVKHKQRQKQNQKEQKEQEAITDSVITKHRRNTDEMELEQTAYEARLAKLMLLSRSKKRKRNTDNNGTDNNSYENEDIAIDYTPQLAFMNERPTGKESKVIGHNEKGTKATTTKNTGSSTTQKMKEMLRRKKAKISKKLEKGNFGDDFEDDSFWS